MSLAPIILPNGKNKNIYELDKDELVDVLEHYNTYTDEWLRRAIIDHNRIDILATEVLGYSVEPFHMKMLKYQFQHPQSLQLIFRGAGKSTLCTITKTIHYLIKNRDLRILLASKTKGNAENFLKEIKGHLETNVRLVELFGPFYDMRKTTKWDNSEIEVLGRKKRSKEGSVTCVGVDSAVVSRHYDIIISDDLIDEENARTKHLREKTRVWYYQTLDPTLEPADPEVPHRGEHHMQGTRYHYDDIYGHLIENELKNHHQVIKALDEYDRSPWPAKYPASWFKKKRENAGIIIFNAQYQNDTEAMKGEVFAYDDCQQLSDASFPPVEDLKIFAGVDLAISEKQTADQFAEVVIGVLGDPYSDDCYYYVLDIFADQLRFSQQTDKIIELHRKWDPITTLIESNAYQLAQAQTLEEAKDEEGHSVGVRVVPHITDKDKMTRAWKLTPVFEKKRIFFRKIGQGAIIDQLVLFPNHALKDLFDALDLAIAASKSKKKGFRKRRVREEPGIIVRKGASR